MKQLISIIVICSFLIIWSSGGCNKPESNVAISSVNEGKSKIPPEIAGTWQMKDGDFRFVIEPNGIVRSAVIQLLNATIRPHQTTKVEMLDGNFSDLNAGDMFAEYNPSNRELFVYIELKSFLIRYFEIRTGGSRRDSFTGTVSLDGKVWKGDWFNVFDYGPDLPQDLNNIEPSSFTFDKIEPNMPTAEGQVGHITNGRADLLIPPGDINKK